MWFQSDRKQNHCKTTTNDLNKYYTETDQNLIRPFANQRGSKMQILKRQHNSLWANTVTNNYWHKQQDTSKTII